MPISAQGFMSTSPCNYPSLPQSLCGRWASLEKHLRPVSAVGISLAQKFLADIGEAGRQLRHGDGRLLGRAPNHAGWKTRQADDKIAGLIKAGLKSLTSRCPHTQTQAHTRMHTVEVKAGVKVCFSVCQQDYAMTRKMSSVKLGGDVMQVDSLSIKLQNRAQILADNVRVSHSSNLIILMLIPLIICLSL